MSTSYDPYRQRQREAVRQAPVTVRPAAGGPRQEPETPAPAATEPTAGASLREQLGALDRDDLTELAGRHGLDTYRVRSAHLVDQLAGMGVRPDSPPPGGMTGVVGPQE